MPDKLPVVLSIALLYDTGVRLEECLELRVKDLDFDRHQILIRRGKGQKDRVTMLPAGVQIYLHVLNRGALGFAARSIGCDEGDVVFASTCPQHANPRCHQGEDGRTRFM